MISKLDETSLASNLLLALERSLLLAVLLLTLGDGRLLVLLVLRHKIVHVGLGLGELHLVHTLAGIPMKESLATEHGGELVADALEEFLDGGAVADEGARHLEAARRDRAEGRLDVVRDPLDEVVRVLVLDVAHLILDLLHRHLAAEDGGASKIATVAEVRGGHHVLGVEHLLRELGNADGTEGVGATAGERSKANHEKVETRERNHVDGQLAEIRVELTRETQASGDAGHDGRDEMVQITIGRVVELESPHADVVESLIVNAESLVRVLNELVNGEGGVVRFNDSVGHFGRWHNRESGHHAVWELLADLGDEESAHTSTGTSTERVGNLEALEAVAGLGLTANHVENLVNKLSTLSVVALCPVVARTRLAKDEVVGTEELAEGTGTDGVHGARLEIDEDGTRYELVARGLWRVSVEVLMMI